MSSDSHPLPHARDRDRIGQEVISFLDDSDSEKVSGNSLNEGISLFNYFETLLSEDGREKDFREVLMPLLF